MRGAKKHGISKDIQTAAKNEQGAEKQSIQTN